MIKFYFSIFCLFVCCKCWSQQQQDFQECADRRTKLMDSIPDGILLLHSRSDVATPESYAFLQEPSFYYFTGLANTLDAILVIDGKVKKTTLFIPKRSGIYKMDSVSSTLLLVDAVRDIEEFVPYIKDRLLQDSTVVFYTSEKFPGPEKVQPMQTPSDVNTQWLLLLKQYWPKAKYASAVDKITALRKIKSEKEIELLRKTARLSVDALLSGLTSIKPGKTQKEIEAIIISACLNKGANGPSQWPLVKTGPNAVAPSSRYRVSYDGFNRVMNNGELGVIFAGCEYQHFSGGASRSFPVGGKFNEEQSEAWDLFIKGYRAALKQVKEGCTTEKMLKTFVDEIIKDTAGLKTSYARKAAREMISGRLLTLWKEHAFTNVGIEGFEGYVSVLKTGMVFRFYPIVFYPGGEGFYISDMILVKKEGYEVLTAGLPFTAKEIEKTMKGERKQINTDHH